MPESDGVSNRFLAIVGASGSGKSSIVRAGLVPALRWQAASADWPILVITPTPHPLDALAASFYKEFKPSLPADQIAAGLASDPAAFHRLVGAAAGCVNAPHVLLVIDQFEELFALCRSEAERKAYIDSVLTAAHEPGGPTALVITMRADFYDRCAPFPNLRQALAHSQEYIGPMSLEELRRAN